ncbi:thioredoxin superfamily protein [Artemisia annua]|uniref:Glutaredoxin-dependent peroxiredoxin n=1 Tax=Artemisia annua TaxID=35608 RepID=A0A2U1LP90_ARTAN|nr:thioredoxin superfamily protein [Artemisia annua]
MSMSSSFVCPKVTETMPETKLTTASSRETRVDMISNLPDTILHLILSRLPSTDEAIRTSILSTRWRYLWTSVHSLNLDWSSKLKPCAKFSKTKFKKFVYSVLLNKAQNFDSLRLCCRDYYNMSTVRRWIQAASMRKVQSLDLMFCAKAIHDRFEHNLPEATLSYFDKNDELQTTTISDLTKSKKTILFAVPGAFTPTCSQKHLPGFVEKAGELKKKGVDTIACVSVNDAFVMKAWGKDLNVGDDVLLLSDGNGEFTKAIGCELDLSDKPVGLGVRSRRYSMLVDDGVVKVLNLEEGGAFTNSGAEDMLNAL